MFAQPPVKTSRRTGVAAFRSGVLARQPHTQPGSMLATSGLGPGQELASDQLALFESRLGHDFSGVRVHANEAAAASAGAIGANAYTIGDDVVFAAGRYRPGTPRGDRLLAHELAHVAQRHRGGSADPAQAEPRAEAAADTVSMGGDVSADAIGGAQEGVYCDDDEEKKEGGAGQSPATSTAPLPAPPYLPPLTLPPLDWGKLNEPFTKRGLRLTTGDLDSILLERQRSSQVLSTLGIGEGFKLGPITKDWILEKGLAKQLEDQQARENPNAIDLMNKDWKQAHPGGWETPIIPIFSSDWFRKKK